MAFDSTDKKVLARPSRRGFDRGDPRVRVFRDIIVAAVALGLLTAFSLWLRSPVADVKGVQNEDVAGILYNADLLLRGKVPLVDNLEYKAPGSFFLTAAVFAVFGRSVHVHELFGIFWAILAMLGVFAGGRVFFNSLASGIVAAFIYAGISPIMDSMTVNYNAWMIAPYIWATVFFGLGLKGGRLRWLVVAGIVAVVGALMKRQGAMIVPLFGLILLLGPWLRAPGTWRPPSRVRGVFAFSLGVFLGFLPIAVYYLAHGALGAFVSQYFGSNAGWEYVQGEVNWSGKIDRLEDGVLGLFKFLVLPTMLAAMGAVSVTLRRNRGWTILGVLLGGHIFMSFVGASLGFRFYKGYYLQLLPAMAWLGAHPEGPILRWFNRWTWPSSGSGQVARVTQLLAVLLLCLPALLPTLSQVKVQRRGRVLRNAYQVEIEQISKVIAESTKPTEGIWVWGRWAWPAYFYSNRISPTRYYKVLGLITTNLTNTWKRPTSMTRFVKKGPWRQIGADLARTRPAFIVCAKNESYHGFSALEKLLRDHYVLLREPRVNVFTFWKRKDVTIWHDGAPAIVK
ncbi:MAG: glycosyltransferase family 39 protein [Deltaproteobacteria bacterium]|nr:glycosyltransferase family 39 protein [Deltaproteobacteria bacterium]